jgi:uncharacterized coiled-coil protein SlyX
MHKLESAMARLNESIDLLNQALDELQHEVENQNDRLQRTLNPNGQDHPTNERCPSEHSPYDGLRLVYDAVKRNRAADAEHRRAKARAGIPTELRDII